MRCTATPPNMKDFRLNLHDMKAFFDAAEPEGKEGCYKVEGYDVFYAKVSHDDWKKSGMDAVDFSDEKSGEMLGIWKNWNPGIDRKIIAFDWVVKPIWDVTHREYIFYAVYKTDKPVVKHGVYYFRGFGVGRHVEFKRPNWKEYKSLDIEKSQRFEDHSSGFEWGYVGSGPAQLSLAMFLEMLPSRVTSDNYKQFSSGFLSFIPKGKDFKLKLAVKDLGESTKTSFKTTEPVRYVIEVTLEDEVHGKQAPVLFDLIVN